MRWMIFGSGRNVIAAGRRSPRYFSLWLRSLPICIYGPSESIDIGRMRKMPPAIRYGIDALLILVPLVVLMYFLFDPAAFNAFTAWLARVL
jgi:hypothetical protein